MFDWQAIHAYCEQHSTSPGPIMEALERETHLKTLAPQMLSGRLVGRFLTMLVQLTRTRVALEIGTFTGYGALSIAGGLPEGGLLHTIEANAELAYIIRDYIQKAGLDDKIKLHIGQVEDIIASIEGSFDFVFIDANKLQYPAYFDLVFDRVNPGGLIVADNTLWSGKVLLADADPDTAALQLFNKKIVEDARVENLMLPLRDGLTLIRKK